jgi:hypothetical protein
MSLAASSKMNICSHNQNRMNRWIPGLLLWLATGIFGADQTLFATQPLSSNVSQEIPEDLTQFDNSAYAKVLSRYVDAQGLVNYSGLKADRADLDRYLASFGALEPMTFNAWNGAAKMTFWINAYNAITLRVIIDHYPIEKLPGGQNCLPANSIRQIPGAWDQLRTNIMGKPVTLDEIEHDMLRKQYDDPRIHMALACGTRGAPPLRTQPYDAKRLDDQLALQARRFLSDPNKLVIVSGAQQIRVSSIFKWFAKDFVPAYETQAPPGANLDEREAVLWFLSQHNETIRWPAVRNWSLVFLPYDWRLNERRESE